MNILFRAWGEKENRMLYIDEFSSSWGTVDSKGVVSDVKCLMTWSGDIFLQVEDGKFEKQSHLILLQYCKCNDKKGKPIYQGDIIKESDDTYRVVHNIVISNEISTFDAEVVGNVYENPELAITLAGKIK